MQEYHKLVGDWYSVRILGIGTKNAVLNRARQEMKGNGELDDFVHAEQARLTSSINARPGADFVDGIVLEFLNLLTNVED